MPNEAKAWCCRGVRFLVAMGSRTGCALAAMLAAISGLAAAGPLPMVDTHVHFESVQRYQDLPGSMRAALAEMDARGIARSLLMSMPKPNRTPPIYDIEELLFAEKAYPGRFAILGGGSSLNVMIHGTAADAVDDELKQRFRARAESILAQGAVGFGEIAIVHLSLPQMGQNHAFEQVPGDHPLLLLLADIAAAHDVPIDIHYDAAPEDLELPTFLRNGRNPDRMGANIDGFKRLLAHNPKARIVWSHVGQEPIQTRGPPLVRRLMRAFPNLYMSFRVTQGGPPRTMALDPELRLKAPWIELLREFPDRFMLGSDTFYTAAGPGDRGGKGQGLDNLRALVDQLPPELASRVASENAIRLYKLER